VTLTLRTLAVLPVHGPRGRVAAVRRALQLRQVDFAQEIVKRGGRTSRESISHWENLDSEGAPRARVSRRNAAVIALLIRDRLGLGASEELFYEPSETPWERLARLQLETAARVDELSRAIHELSAQLIADRN
jgi:hypothetical protein